jgi:hypothetical protein
MIKFVDSIEFLMVIKSSYNLPAEALHNLARENSRGLYNVSHQTSEGDLRVSQGTY